MVHFPQQTLRVLEGIWFVGEVRKWEESENNLACWNENWRIAAGKVDLNLELEQDLESREGNSS